MEPFKGVVECVRFGRYEVVGYRDRYHGDRWAGSIDIEHPGLVAAVQTGITTWRLTVGDEPPIEIRVPGLAAPEHRFGHRAMATFEEIVPPNDRPAGPHDFYQLT